MLRNFLTKNNMRDVTMFRRGDGSVDYVVWKDRENPTDAEFNPPNAKLIIHTVFPHDTIEWLKHITKEKVNAFLNTFIPK